MFWKKKTQIDKCWMTSEVFLYGCVFTVQGRPSTVASLNSCPTVKLTWVVLTEVEVLIDSVSPSWVISTDGFDAAATAILRSITFTPDKTHQNNLLKNTEYSGVHITYGKFSIYRVFESDVIKTGCAPHICALYRQCPMTSPDIILHSGKAI